MRLPLTLITVMISFVLPFQSRASTTTYPQPLPPTTVFTTAFSEQVSTTGCQNPASNDSYSNSSPVSYSIPLPLGGEPGQVGALGGLPNFLADSTPFPTVTLPAPLGTILTLVNGVSEYQGAITPVVQTLQFSSPTGTQTRTYTLFVSGSVVKETLVSVYAYAGTDNEGYDQGNSTYNLTSSYDISTGVQTFSLSWTLSSTNSDNPNGPGCVTVQTAQERGSGTASYYASVPITIVPSLPAGMENVAYPSTATVSGGVAPTVVIEGLPAGLTHDASGNISGTPATGTAAKSPYQITISASDTKNDSAGPVMRSLTITAPCPAPTVLQVAGGKLSKDQLPTAMIAQFSPLAADGSPTSLSAAASACGYMGFDWQQTIVSWPAPRTPSDCPQTPSPCLESASGNVLVAPPAFSDPPSGGYDYTTIQRANNPFYQAYPFYYDPSVVDTGCAYFDNGACNTPITNDDGQSLIFYDAPRYPQLPTRGSMEFTTSLVGVLAGNTPGPRLYTWSWVSTYNGDEGGIAETASSQPVNGSGTGGVQITSINGLAQTPPSATCKATPVIVWQPDDKSISLTVSGKITAGTSALASSTYQVSNEDGRFTRSGTFTVGAGGSYSFSVLLKSWQKDRLDRDGHGRHDRKYTVDVRAKDAIGNLGTCSTTVTLPHDWDHKP